MTYHIGYTGTRRGMTEAQKRKVEGLIYSVYAAHTMPGEQVVGHHGDCVGGDSEFHGLLREISVALEHRHTRIVVYPAAIPQLRAYCQGDETRNPKPPMVRNQDIVDAVAVESPSDEDDSLPPERGMMIAAPWESVPQVRGGTWTTIRMALKALRSGRLGSLWVVGPNGRLMDYKEW